MNGLAYGAFDTWWWPWIFLLIAGFVANDAWRFLGVVFSGRLRETSPVFLYVRSVATALVAGVIGQLVIYPSGELAATTLQLRLFAVAVGFAAFRLARQNIFVGVAVGEVAFVSALWLGL